MSAVLYLLCGVRERRAVRDRLMRSGVPVTIAADLSGAVSELALRSYALCVLDLVDEAAALAAIRLIRTQHPQQPLAGVIDPAHPLVAGQAVFAGLVDLLPWPFEDRDLLTLVANGADRRGVDLELARPGTAAEALFAQAPTMRPVLEAVQRAAGGAGGVCITGEPGTGRELVARVIHGLSERAGSGPFVMVDCRAAAPQDLERRLFGTTTDRRSAAVHTAGVPDRIGQGSAMADARGGTLYLTGLADASARVQTRLARLLRDGEALLGATGECVDLDIRPVGSFDPDVETALGDGHLHRDLYERLAQIRIDVPPLRRRRQDIPLLAAHLLADISERQGGPRRTLSRSALSLLMALPWHGNAPELRALLEAAATAVRRPVLQLDDLLEHASLDGLSARIETGTTLRDARERFERECISAVLIRHHGRVGEAAKALGIQRTNLYRKVRQLNVARSLLSARK